jgi:hypothetical protein
VCLLASAVVPSGKLTGVARATRLATSAGAMGLVFMGAIVLPVYLVPALTLVLAAGLAAEAHPALKRPGRRVRRTAPKPGQAAGRVEMYRSRTGTA